MSKSYSYPLSYVFTSTGVNDVFQITFNKRSKIKGFYLRQLVANSTLRIWDETNGSTIPTGIKSMPLVFDTQIIVGGSINVMVKGIRLNTVCPFHLFSKSWNVRTLYFNGTLIGQYAVDFHYDI